MLTWLIGALLLVLLLRALIHKPASGPGAPETRPQTPPPPDLPDSAAPEHPPTEAFLVWIAPRSGEPAPATWSRRISQSDRLPSWGTGAFIDSETTGFTRSDELIELAIILFCFDRETARITGVLDTYSGLREPMVDINPRATQKNHITYGMVAGKELDCERVEGILDQADLIVAHNAPFDKRFVGKLFPRANAKTWLCSMNGIDWMSHGMTSKSLDHLLPQHGFHSGPKHRALSDAAATLHLLQKPALSGEPYFAELLHRSLKSRTSSYVTGPSSAIIKP